VVYDAEERKETMELERNLLPYCSCGTFEEHWPKTESKIESNI
jgi:hypothetical protein